MLDWWKRIWYFEKLFGDLFSKENVVVGVMKCVSFNASQGNWWKGIRCTVATFVGPACYDPF